MLTAQAACIQPFLKDSYTTEDLQKLETLLNDAGTFRFEALSNGLFPAALALQDDTEYTGYSNCWVRDNVLVAWGLYASGRVEPAVRSLQTLAQYFLKSRHRFDNLITGKSDPSDPMQRPHIRIRGEQLEEIDQHWAHAQNDALGYFLWAFSRLACDRVFEPTSDQIDLMILFVETLHALKFWEDEDSGHWEEVRKIAASSIGTATAGLLEFSRFYDERADLFQEHQIACERIDILEDSITRGRNALYSILPAECVQEDPLKNRKYDAALLFLIEPLQIVNYEMADKIISDIQEHLQGDYGIRRYVGDSYWCADYKEKLSPEQRTDDFSDNQETRDALLQKGEEAQWCIFDPILSVIYAKRYHHSGDKNDREKQIHYFQRALTQLTAEDCRMGGLRCPESYYLENGTYVPNDITPLLWTQANLLQSLEWMKKTTETNSQ